MEAVCSHGMPSPASCFTCMEDGNLPPPPGRRPPQPEGAPFEARFPGQCAGCNLGIHEGQSITRMDNGTYQHAHHHTSSPWDVLDA